MRRQTEYHLCDLASRTNRHLSGFARRNENTHQTRIQRTNVCIKFDLESIGSSIYGLVYILFFLLLLSVSHTNHTHTSTHTHRHCQRTTIRCNIHMIVDFYTMSFSITALISSVCLPIHLKLKIRYNMCWPMLITHGNDKLTKNRSQTNIRLEIRTDRWLGLRFVSCKFMTVHTVLVIQTEKFNDVIRYKRISLSVLCASFWRSLCWLPFNKFE